MLLGQEICGRRLGIIGAGRIGCAMLRRAQGFAMDLVYDSPRDVPEADALGARRVDREELFRTSDFVSLHCPLTASTRYLVDAAALSLMKPTAILVNTARGEVIDENALTRMLDSGLCFKISVLSSRWYLSCNNRSSARFSREFPTTPPRRRDICPLRASIAKQPERGLTVNEI